MANLATDPDAQAAYDEPGSWGRLSNGWPSTPYTPAKFLLCTKANIVPYGQYVVVGNEYTWPHKRQQDGSWYDYSHAEIRCASVDLRDKLESVYNEMFVKCRVTIEQDLRWKS